MEATAVAEFVTVEVFSGEATGASVGCFLLEVFFFFGKVSKGLDRGLIASGSTEELGGESPRPGAFAVMTIPSEYSECNEPVSTNSDRRSRFGIYQ